MTQNQVTYLYQCPHCKEESYAEEWNEATFNMIVDEELLDIEDDDEFYEQLEALERQFVSIDDTNWDGWNWYICPACLKTAWNKPDSIVKRPERLKFMNNLQAKYLLEKSW